MSLMRPLAVYVHWPWCRRICPYCDFNVYKARDLPGLVEAMARDLAARRETTGAREIVSVHFGGGTPSLMAPRDVERLLGAVDGLWGLPARAEVGLEANPHEISEDKMRAFAGAGVNRVSLGVQTFSDTGLARLGRDHDGAQARLATTVALRVLETVSLDLIFGWAGQDLAGWERDLETALALGVPHISAYQLMIEPGTAFARAEARGRSRAVGAALSADMYELAEGRLTAAGYGHYEVSNYARPGWESRHNRAYWWGDDYLGIGPGAHGRIAVGGTRLASVTPRKPADYIEDPTPEFEPLDASEQAVEYALLGLRAREGIELDRYARLAGREPKLAGLDGLVEVAGRRLRATRDGWAVLDSVLERLL